MEPARCDWVEVVVTLAAGVMVPVGDGPELLFVGANSAVIRGDADLLL